MQETSAAKIAESKLHENLKKLQVKTSVCCEHFPIYPVILRFGVPDLFATTKRDKKDQNASLGYNADW